MPKSKRQDRTGSRYDELRELPGVGPATAADLRILGVRSVTDLARRDPERLYHRLCQITRQRQDPCVAYVFRCAVYAARTRSPKPELLQWWAWKDRRLPPRARRAAPAR